MHDTCCERENLKLLSKLTSPAYLKKKEDRIPCAALFNIRSIVAFECPSKILKLSGPEILKTSISGLIFKV